MDEVVADLTGAEHDEGAALERFGELEEAHLARSIDGCRTHHQDRDSKRGAEFARQDLARVFAFLIVVVRFDRRILVGGWIGDRSVHADGRALHEALTPAWADSSTMLRMPSTLTSQ